MIGMKGGDASFIEAGVGHFPLPICNPLSVSVLLFSSISRVYRQNAHNLPPAIIYRRYFYELEQI
jgi:hypothetical protein